MINITYNDLIWGDKFKNLSNSIFIKIDDVYQFLKNNTANKLITHNGDYPVNEKYNQFLTKINFWFAQNAYINNSKIIPIPIGLENDYVKNSVAKKTLLLEYRTSNIAEEKLLYINHNIGTNPIERKLPYDLYKSNDYITVEDCSGFDSQHNYYSKIKKHTFVLSPPGNGLDCHRTWEILYCDRYPILKDIGRMRDLYQDLPVVFINSYEELTKDFLHKKQLEFKNKNFNYEKLKFKYWKDLIEQK